MARPHPVGATPVFPFPLAHIHRSKAIQQRRNKAAGDEPTRSRSSAPSYQSNDETGVANGYSPQLKPAKSARRREQCRANQARYRERQKLRLAIEEEEVACLRELVGLLQAQRTFMRTASDPSFEYVQHVVASFFHRFKRGLPTASAEAPAGSSRWTKAGRAGRNPALLKQIAFVRCVVSEDAEFGWRERGPDAVLEQCWWYSALHSNLRVELMSIQRSSPSCAHVERVVATVRVNVDMTKQTISSVFPGLSTTLRSKLLGQKVEYSAQFDLEFSRVQSSLLLQLVWAVARVNLVETFTRLLHDIVEVEEVLRCAQISIHV